MWEMICESEINRKKGFRESIEIRARERLAMSGSCGWKMACGQ